jgi:hypothetical protein
MIKKQLFQFIERDRLSIGKSNFPGENFQLYTCVEVHININNNKPPGGLYLYIYITVTLTVCLDCWTSEICDVVKEKIKDKV